jgi:hypothetical protein
MATKHNFGIKGVVGEVKEPSKGGGMKVRPPEGTYKGKLTQMKLNTQGDVPILITVTELIMPKSKKALAKSDGYWVWERFRLTDQAAPYLNGFLNALAGSEKAGLVLQKDVWERGALETKEEDGGDVLRIGKFKVGSPEGTRLISLALTHDEYVKRGTEDEMVETVRVTRWMSATGSLEESDDEEDVLDDTDDTDDLEDDDSIDDDDDEDEDDDDLDDDDSDDDEDEDEDEDGDADDEEAALRSELADLDLKALRLKARDDLDISAADTKGKSEEEVIDMIVEAALGDDADDDDDDDDDDLDDEPAKPAAKRKGKKGEPPF